MADNWKKAYSQAVSITNVYKPKSFENFKQEDKDEMIAHEMYLHEVLEQSEQEAKWEKKRTEMLQKREIEEQMRKAKEEEEIEKAKIISKELEEQRQKEKDQLRNPNYMLVAQELNYKNVIEPEQSKLLAKFKEDIHQRTHTLITQTIKTVVENKLEEVMTSLKPTIETVVDKWLDRHKMDATDKERDDCNLEGRLKGIEAKIIGLEKVQRNLMDKFNCKVDNTKIVLSKEINELNQEFNQIREQFNKNSEERPLPKHDMTLDELRKYDGLVSDVSEKNDSIGDDYDIFFSLEEEVEAKEPKDQMSGV